MRRINTKAELAALGSELGVRPDWHEPDEVGVTATTHGKSFDTAGFWPKDKASFTPVERYVVLKKDGKAVAAVNLALLFAWATGYGDD